MFYNADLCSMEPQPTTIFLYVEDFVRYNQFDLTIKKHVFSDVLSESFV